MLLIEKGLAIPEGYRVYYDLFGHDELTDTVIMLDTYYRGMR